VEHGGNKLIIRSFWLPPALDECLMRLVRRGVFNNFSEAVRLALIDSLPTFINLLAVVGPQHGRTTQRRMIRPYTVNSTVSNVYRRLVEAGLFMNESEAWRLAIILFLIKMFKAEETWRSLSMALH